MTEFTKGPWLIEYDSHGNGGFSEWWNVGPAKVHIDPKNKDQAAVDTFLIAAAPTMYNFVASRAGSGDNEAIAIMEAINGNP